MATRYLATHDECGFVGTPTTKARAEQALRQHSCERHRPTATGHGHGQQDPSAAVVGEPCGLTIDLASDAAAPAVGNWIVTKAGSRYLITASRTVRPRTPGQAVRYQLRCLRLARNCPVPEDIRAIALRWHRR